VFRTYLLNRATSFLIRRSPYPPAHCLSNEHRQLSDYRRRGIRSLNALHGRASPILLEWVGVQAGRTGVLYVSPSRTWLMCHISEFQWEDCRSRLAPSESSNHSAYAARFLCPPLILGVGCLLLTCGSGNHTPDWNCACSYCACSEGVREWRESSHGVCSVLYCSGLETGFLNELWTRLRSDEPVKR